MKKVTHPKSTSPATIIVTSVCIALVIAAIIAALVISLSPAIEDAYERLTVNPGELVDKAMAMPHAIVVSPHEDLIKKGWAKMWPTLDCEPEFNLNSPAIAIHVYANAWWSPKWCVWELGMGPGGWHPANECAKLGTALGSSMEIFTSEKGYQSAFDQFQKCVKGE